MDFISAVKETAQKFKQLDKKPVRIISHLDSDGISSAAIISKALEREGVKFALSIVRQITPTLLDELKREPYEVFLFTDLGSGYLKMLESELVDKTVFILDHHKPESKKTSFNHLNPHLFGIDGARDISGAGVVYLFCKSLNEENIDLAHLAIIGAIGDIQEDKGFSELNNKILEDAVKVKKIEVKKGLRMFGIQSKPIHKVLEYSTNPYIPNVTGSEEGAKQFLSEVGINIRDGGKYRKLVNLNEEEMKKLVTAIVLKRLGSEKDPDDVLGPIYLLVDEKEENPTKDAREFSTLLNACGRLNKPSLGIGALLGNKKIKKKAVNLLTDYKREIIRSLDWFYTNRSKLVEKKGYVLINAGDNVRDTLIGTLVSIISRLNIYPKGTILISMAYTMTDEIKISTRVCGYTNDEDLRKIMKKIIDQTGGIAGGHRLAAGALIPQEKEEEFIKVAEIVLNKTVIEEKVK